MLFVIKYLNRKYFSNEGKIILYESQDEANVSLNQFLQYSINRLMIENRIEEAMMAHIDITSKCKILEIDFDINLVECGVVYFKELLERNSSYTNNNT